MPAIRDALNIFARQFSLALHHSTRVRLGGPLAPPEDADPDTLRASDAHLPGTGWIVGVAACLVFALVGLLLRASPWGAAAAAVVSTILTVVITGARHESAAFRAAERLGSGHGFGVLAVVLLLAGKIVLLAAIASVSEAGVLAALFAAHVTSRLAPVVATRWLGDRQDVRALRIGALWCVVPLLLMFPASGWAFPLLAVLLAASISYGVLWLWERRFGPGAQEDAGALQQAWELAFYLGAAIGA